MADFGFPKNFNRLLKQLLNETSSSSVEDFQKECERLFSTRGTALRTAIRQLFEYGDGICIKNLAETFEVVTQKFPDLLDDLVKLSQAILHSQDGLNSSLPQCDILRKTLLMYLRDMKAQVKAGVLKCTTACSISMVCSDFPNVSIYKDFFQCLSKTLQTNEKPKSSLSPSKSSGISGRGTAMTEVDLKSTSTAIEATVAIITLFIDHPKGTWEKLRKGGHEEETLQAIFIIALQGINATRDLHVKVLYILAMFCFFESTDPLKTGSLGGYVRKSFESAGQTSFKIIAKILHSLWNFLASADLDPLIQKKDVQLAITAAFLILDSVGKDFCIALCQMSTSEGRFLMDTSKKEKVVERLFSQFDEAGGGDPLFLFMAGTTAHTLQIVS